MLKILLVEDNKIIASNIKRYMELDWHYVMIVENWLYAMEVVKHQPFDVIILDIMLPWMDWITICKNIKNINPIIPIIMTTAKGQLDDKLEWFSSWADDYLVKPFDIEELMARIQALLKRTAKRNVVEYKNLVLHRDQKKVYKNNKELKFTLKEYLIVELLMMNIWKTISRTDIIEEIWWNDKIYEEDAKLDVYISKLRKKLWKTAIETVHWFWYKMK